MSDEHCKDCCCAQSLKALGISEYTGKSIPEHIAELQSENARLSSLLTESLVNEVYAESARFHGVMAQARNDQLNSEVARWKRAFDMQTEENGKLVAQIHRLFAERDQLKAFKERVMAEVGPEPSKHQADTDLSPKWVSEDYAKYHKHRSEHLAARLVELRSCKAVLRGAIEKTLRENGHLADGDNCTLIDLKQALAQSQPAPSAAQIDDAISGTRVDVAPLPLSVEMSNTKQNRNRPALNPGGVECERCGRIFIGEEWQKLCAVCVVESVPLEPLGEKPHNCSHVRITTEGVRTLCADCRQVLFSDSESDQEGGSRES